MQKIKCKEGKCWEPKKTKKCDEEDLACQIEKDLDKETIGDDFDKVEDEDEFDD